MDSPLAAMKAGVAAFLDECAEPGFQQIVLHDAPAVLGWERWREIAAANGLGLIEASLIAAIEAGEIRAAAGETDGPPPARRPRRGGDAPRPLPRSGRAEPRSPPSCWC